jgi:hypothetical protein
MRPLADTRPDEERCRLCGGAVARKFELTVLGAHRVGYSACEACGSLQSERPYWLHEAYAQSLSALDTGAGQRNLHNFALCYVLQRVFRVKTAVDVGGGDGLLCRLLRDLGVDAYVDDKYATPSYAQGFTRPGFAAPDLAIAFEVVEHFANPGEEWAALFALRARVWIVSTARYAGEGPDWWYLAPESGQHVFFYSERALRELGTRHGLETLVLGEHILYARPDELTLWRRRLLRLLFRPGLRRVIRALAVAAPTPGAWRDHLAMKARGAARP